MKTSPSLRLSAAVRPSRAPFWLQALLAAALLAACGTRKAGAEGASVQPDAWGDLGDLSAGAGGPVVVVGTTIEASTRMPLAGVRVEGPGGVVADSDADGRFVLRGLAPGAEGALQATTSAGLAGSLRLRPLQRGRLEVVVFLRPKAP